MNNDKILFLDFDGIVFPDRIIKYHPLNRRSYPGNLKMPDNVDYWKMEELAVYVLNFLYDLVPFKTVISSSWSTFINKEQYEDLFYTNGLELKLHPGQWCTEKIPTFSGYTINTRAFEIQRWVEKHSPSDYLILDDLGSGSSLDEADHTLNRDRIIMTDYHMGLSDSDIAKMFKIIKGWKSITRLLK